MLNRKSPPAIFQVQNLLLPRPELVHLDNGIPVYILDFPGQEIVKIEAVFRAGRPEESKRLASRATAKLLREGTRTRSAAEIAEHVDYFGGSLNVPTNLDSSNVILFSLKKYIHELLPVFAEVLQEPSFPETELETFRRTSLQELQVDLEKVEVQAYRKVTELIFGENHPYGYNSVAEDYAALTRDDLVQHFNTWYTPSNCMLFASGRIDAPVRELLNRYFGQNTTKGPTPLPLPVAATSKPHKEFIHQPESLQSAIKVGRRLFGRDHPDFNGIFVLNTILGGYFGSRLMTNIREKKGYTYNIYSTADAMLHDGCLYIATEVSKDKSAATLRAILAEMKKLREKPVLEDEMDMVRNYLLGMLLNGLDGPMNIADVVRSLVVEGLPWESYEALVQTIRHITPAELQELAQRYLRPEDFWIVTVGA
ncbi:MAG TPA: pitrilysin family protein [Saprospiraceae bacterium]|nr:pitrilysin family protein [Saprospiraceae bacterium]HPI08310.1 pitrilysin family protein [Saprospiraceae bacterium]